MITQSMLLELRGNGFVALFQFVQKGMAYKLRKSESSVASQVDRNSDPISVIPRNQRLQF